MNEFHFTSQHYQQQGVFQSVFNTHTVCAWWGWGEGMEAWVDISFSWLYSISLIISGMKQLLSDIILQAGFIATDVSSGKMPSI